MNPLSHPIAAMKPLSTSRRPRPWSLAAALALVTTLSGQLTTLDNPAPPCCSCIVKSVLTQSETGTNTVLVQEELGQDSDCIDLKDDPKGQYNLAIDTQMSTAPECSGIVPIVELRDKKGRFWSDSGTHVEFTLDAMAVDPPIDVRVLCATDQTCITDCLDAGCESCKEGDCAAGASPLDGNVSASGAGGTSGEFSGSMGVGTSHNGDSSTALEFGIDPTLDLGIADLKTNSSGGYTVSGSNPRIITTDTVQAQISSSSGANPGDGDMVQVDLYLITNATPETQRFRNIIFENLASGILKATLTDYNPNGTQLSTATYEWRHPSAAIWEFVAASGLRKKTVERESLTTTLRMERHQVFERPHGGSGEADILISDRRLTFELLGVQWRKIKEMIDPGGAALVTEWSYYEPGETTGPSSTYGAGLLKWMRRHDGYEELHSYAENWHMVTTCFAGSNAGKTIATTWNPDTSTSTVIEAVSGTTVAKKERLFGTNTITEALYTSPTDYLTTTTTYVAAGEAFGGRPSKIVHPDGTLTTYDHDIENGEKVVVMCRGAGTATVTEGARTETTFSGKGVLIEEKTTALGTGADVILAHRKVGTAAGDRDWFGRPLRVQHFPAGPQPWTEEIAYDCCGVTSRSDQYGITTTYGHDLLGRVTSTSRLGVTTVTVFIGANPYGGTTGSGLATTTTRNLTLIGKQLRNLAGTYTEHWGASPQTGTVIMLSNEATTFWNPGGTPVTLGSGIGRSVVQTAVAVADDGSTVPSQTNLYFLDGRLHKTTGALSQNSIHFYYEYGYGQSGYGQFSYDWLLDGATVREPSLRVVDLAGRLIMEYFRDNTRGVTYHHYYTSNGPAGQARIGKPWYSSDPDSVRTLYDYNQLGEQVLVCRDLNADNVLDYGTDQITRTETAPLVAGRTAGQTQFDVLRTLTKVWQDGAAVATVRIDDRTPDGLRRWTEILPYGQGANHGLSTSVTSLTGGGSWITSTTRPDGTTVEEGYENGLWYCTWEYDPTYQLNAFTVALKPDFSAGYDLLNRLTHVMDSRSFFNETYATTTTAYRSSVSDAVASVTDPAGNVTAYTYDHRGRRTEVDAEETLDAGGQPVPNDTVTCYYPDGSVKEITGDQTYPTSYTYDHAGRIKTLTTYGTTTTITAWTYDPLYGYLLGKRYNSNTDGTTGVGPDYTYTNGGRIATRKWARSFGSPATRVQATYSYTAGQLTGINYNDATPDVVIDYDALGRVDRMTQGGVEVIDNTYDPATLALDTEELTIDPDYSGGGAGFTRVLDRSHDAILRPTGYALKEGTNTDTAATWAWHADHGRLAGVTAEPTGYYKQFTYGYVPFTRALVGTLTGPVHKAESLYEPARDILKWKANLDREPQPNPIAKVEYGTPWSGTGAIPAAANQIGQRILATYSGPAYTDNGRSGTNTYGYNDRGEVADAARLVPDEDPPHDLIAAAGEHFGYQFDGIGNRNTASVDGNTVDSYTHNPLNQYTAIDSQSRSYDLDGNLADDGNLLYTWDAENRLSAVNRKSDNALIAQYAYDPFGRRVWKLTTSIAAGGPAERIFCYEGWNLVAEYAVGYGYAALLRAYIWGSDLSGTLQGAGGIGGLLAIRTGSGETATVHYPLYDGNGNVTQLIKEDDGSDLLVAHYEYDPFGNLTKSLDLDQSGFNAVNPFRFSTKYFDQETGFYYYGYRYMDPQTGRWPSRDAIGERGGVDLYGFVRNDGIVNIDILGQNYRFHGVSRVRSIYWGFVLGFTDAKGALITLCKCDKDDDNRWKTKLVAFWVHTQIYVRTHIAAEKQNAPLIHIPRPDDFINADIKHEEIHVGIVKNWHDISEPQIKVDFDPELHSFESFDLCEQYRKERVRHWRDQWFGMKANQDGRPEFNNDPSKGGGINGLVPPGYTPNADDPNGTRHYWNWTFDGS